ncbi:hypothetical protein H312_01214 [Anncaliia algerae PRA339]|uniref:Amino acid transporter transmembrane domain-containing protein n=1 Tax=Anncaliia algerae PRA339 TaxID=1288291 RepID=A0A059F2A5_9MICR|nr:hypothetical protein H312_01214 [Anncaliia algerae PRA339]
MQEFLTAYVNLLETTSGAGILMFPYLFKVYGMFNFILITLIFCVLVYFGLFFLICCAEEYEDADYNILINKIIKNSSYFLDFFIFAKCLGVSISYLIISQEILIFLLSDIFYIPDYLLLLIFILLLFPLCYSKNISQLKYTSFISTITTLVTSLLIDFIFNERGFSNNLIYYKFPEYSWLSNISSLVFAFSCHVNFFTIRNEVSQNRKYVMTYSSALSLFTASLTSLKFGLICYLIFGEESSKNIFENFPKDMTSRLLKLLYFISITLTFPLQIHPCKKYFMSFLRIKQAKNINFIITAVILVLCYGITILKIKLDMIFKLIGSTSSTLLMLILPSIYYLFLINDSTILYAFANINICVGIFIFVFTIFGL